MEARLTRVRREMRDHGVDALCLSVGNDLPYVTGYRAMASERLTMAVIRPDGPVALVVPLLEEPRVERREGLEVIAWTETDDPIALVTARLSGARTVAVGDETWARFVLALQAASPETTFVPASPLTAAGRVRKEPEEIDALRAAAAAADRVVERLAGTRFSGRTERDLAAEIGRYLLDEGCEAVSFVIVAAGPNSASPHHEPGSRVMEPGDAVVVDFGGSVDGYHSDTTRTFHIGPPSAAYVEAHDVLQRAQEAGRNAVAVGVPAESVDAAARTVISEAGFEEHFIHRTGHGIGLDIHEAPYLVAGNGTPLEAGMAFSVEPGIYLPGRFGMRIEDIVVVTANGPDVLNTTDRGVRIVA